MKVHNSSSKIVLSCFLDALKIYFRRFFQIKCFAINTKWTKLSQHQLIDRLWLCYKFLCSIFSEESQSIDSIKPNVNLTHKVKYIVKLMEVWSCFPIYGKLENHYEKLENNENNENHYRIITRIVTRNSGITRE